MDQEMDSNKEVSMDDANDTVTDGTADETVLHQETLIDGAPVLQTQMPLTQMPPTQMPPTQMPLTQMPPTQEKGSTRLRPERSVSPLLRGRGATSSYLHFQS